MGYFEGPRPGLPRQPFPYGQPLSLMPLDVNKEPMGDWRSDAVWGDVNSENDLPKIPWQIPASCTDPLITFPTARTRPELYRTKEPAPPPGVDPHFNVLEMEWCGAAVFSESVVRFWFQQNDLWTSSQTGLDSTDPSFKQKNASEHSGGEKVLTELQSYLATSPLDDMCTCSVRDAHRESRAVEIVKVSLDVRSRAQILISALNCRDGGDGKRQTAEILEDEPRKGVVALSPRSSGIRSPIGSNGLEHADDLLGYPSITADVLAAQRRLRAVLPDDSGVLDFISFLVATQCDLRAFGWGVNHVVMDIVSGRFDFNKTFANPNVWDALVGYLGCRARGVPYPLGIAGPLRPQYLGTNVNIVEAPPAVMNFWLGPDETTQACCHFAQTMMLEMASSFARTPVYSDVNDYHMLDNFIHPALSGGSGGPRSNGPGVLGFDGNQSRLPSNDLLDSCFEGIHVRNNCELYLAYQEMLDEGLMYQGTPEEALTMPTIPSLAGYNI